MIARANNLARRRRGGWTPLLLAALVYTVVMVGYCAWRAERSTDFRDFWRTAQHFRDAGQISSELGVHNYLPFFTIFMVPWTLLPLPVALGVFTVFSMMLLAATIWMIEVLLEGGIGPRPSRATLITIGLMLPFIHATITVGTVNILLLFLIVASWFLVERGREWEAGFPLGLAVLIKLLPAVLIVFFLIKLRWRVALSAITLAMVLGVGLPLSAIGPAATVTQHDEFYRRAVIGQSARTTVMAEKPRKAKYNNQSVPIVLRRLLSPIDANAGTAEDRFFVSFANLSGRTVWLIYVALMLIALAAGVLPLVRRSTSWPPQDSCDVDATRAQFGAWCCLMLVFSPLAWTHYFVLAFWPLAVVADRADRTRRARARPCGVLLCLLVTWLIADVLIAWPPARAAGVHMLAVAALFGVLVWPARRAGVSG